MNSKIKRDLVQCFELLDSISSYDSLGNVTSSFLEKIMEMQESFKTKQINEPDYVSLCLEIDTEFETYIDSVKSFNK